MLDRLQIAVAMREIAALLRVHGGQRWKARAYERAGAALEALQDAVPLDEPARLREVPGIGPATARTIAELRTAGRSPVLDRLREDLPQGVLQLQQIPHLTLRRIRLLQQALGIDSVDDRRSRSRSTAIRTASTSRPSCSAWPAHAGCRSSSRPTRTRSRSSRTCTTVSTWPAAAA